MAAANAIVAELSRSDDLRVLMKPTVRRLAPVRLLTAGALLALASPTFVRAEDGPAADIAPQAFGLHVQFTSVTQYHPSFQASVTGPNSLDNGNRGDTTNDATLFAGARLWPGAELWINPEVDQGFGLSDTLGVAGFPSGEAYKVGENSPYVRVQRLFFRQTVNLGGERQKVEGDQNVLGGAQSANRLVFTLGKFSVVDIFDNNRYAHDTKNDFLNWSLIDTGSYDYAADAWGYSYGAAAEWYEGDWTGRVALFDLSNVPNSKDLDSRLGQFEYTAEVERRYALFGQPGAVRLTGYLNRGRMASLAEAVRQAQLSGAPPDTVPLRRYASRGGVGLSAEQQLLDGLGVFLRAGWSEGDKETYEFTDIDHSVAAGVSVSGSHWGRADDTFGWAGVVNTPSAQRKAFLAAGGLGILIGDGRLVNSGPEEILETYYSLGVVRGAHLSIDYQFITNPGYDRDRGPVSVFGVRVHGQY
jgi:high affinity Mn2+ porin